MVGGQSAVSFPTSAFERVSVDTKRVDFSVITILLFLIHVLFSTCYRRTRMYHDMMHYKFRLMLEVS